MRMIVVEKITENERYKDAHVIYYICTTLIFLGSLVPLFKAIDYKKFEN